MTIFLKNKLFRIFLTTSALGNIGRTLFDIAFIIYATTMTNPELAVSIVSIATTFPYVISFILGYLSDKTYEKYDAVMRTRFYQVLLFGMFAFACIFGVNWWVFFVIVAVNVISDILGGYNGYLSLSINTRLVDEEDLSPALAFNSSVYNTISLIGKGLGVFLLGLLSYNYSYFGLINALLFFLALVILFYKKDEMKLKIGYFTKTNNNDEKISIRQFFKDTFVNIKVLREIKKIYKFVFLFSGINFYSAAMHALFLVLIVKNRKVSFC